VDDREFLKALYAAAVSAVDPERLVTAALGRRGRAVYVRSVSDARRREFVFVPARVTLLAVGKAAVPMATAAWRTLGERVTSALVIAPEIPSGDPFPSSWRVLAGGHPHPDASSLTAGQAALDLCSGLERGDLLLALLSGGGSSLMELPAGELTLEDIGRTAALLMAAGTPIKDINLVRGSLSRVKAGRLSTAAAQAHVVTLVLSDLGDEGWHLVASGPTLGTPPSRREAIDVLTRYRLLPLTPVRVRHYLELPVPSGSYSLTTGQRWSVLLGDIRTALDGARHAAVQLGAEARVMTELLSGEARSMARRLAVAGACAGNLVRRVPHPRRLVTIFGGETTVTLKGPGRGGRNRELALASAWPIAGVPGACVLCAGTDGVDYGAEAAGAFVDETTLVRAAEKGIDPDLALMMNDSGPFFENLGDAFSPGPTGTNVGDVAFVLAPHDGTPRRFEPPDEEIPIPFAI
jgi:hydroxypyruvate reductase